MQINLLSYTLKQFCKMLIINYLILLDVVLRSIFIVV